MPPVPNIMAIDPAALIAQLHAGQPAVASTAAPHGVSFSEMLLGGAERTNASLLQAEHLVTAFATDDSIPVHQVTFALEQARQNLELMMQVRGRLLDAYQQFMSMQL